MGRSGWHCLGTKDWANTREELAGCGLAHPPLEAGGGGEGKGGKLGPREGIPYQTANRLPISNQRLPEILDGWHLPGESQLEIAPQKRHKEHWTRHTWELRLGLGRGEVALHLGRVCSSSSWLPELLWWGRHKMQAQPSLLLCGVPENLNLSGLGLGSARNSRPAPCRAARSLSSVDGESTHAVSGGKPSVAQTLLPVLPTHASGICLWCPSLPTARLNKRT